MKGENLVPDSVIDSVGGYEQFEQLVKRGKQMHDQAVFELIARLPSKAILSLKQGWDHLVRQQGSKDHGPVLYSRQ